MKLLLMHPTETVLNDNGVDLDFRVESNGNANMLFVDGGSDHVNVGTATDLGATVNVLAGTTNGTMFDAMVLTGGANSTSGSGARLYISGTANDPIARGTIVEGKSTDNGNTHELNFYVSGNSAAPTRRMTIGHSETVFNEDSLDMDFRIESNTHADTFVVDGGTGSILIQGGTDSKLRFSGNGPLLSLGDDDSQIRMANQVIHADNSGNTHFHICNAYGATSADAELSLEGGYVSVNTGTSYTECARFNGSGFFKAGSATATRFGGSYHELLNNTNTSGQRALVIGNRTGDATNNTSSISVSVSDASNDRLKIFGNGDVVNVNNSYGSSSDVKIKENIVDASPKLNDLLQVKVRNYNIIGESTKQLGVVAQELETVFPGMVDDVPDYDMEGNNLGTVTKSVKYSVFVPMLVKAMQEQQTLIESLTARITTLEG